MHAHEELLGADFYEHDIRHPGVGVSRAVSVLKHYYDDVDPEIEPRKGNKGNRPCIIIIVFSRPFPHKPFSSFSTEANEINLFSGHEVFLVEYHPDGKEKTNQD